MLQHLDRRSREALRPQFLDGVQFRPDPVPERCRLPVVDVVTRVGRAVEPRQDPRHIDNRLGAGGCLQPGPQQR